MTRRAHRQMEQNGDRGQNIKHLHTRHNALPPLIVPNHLNGSKNRQHEILLVPIQAFA